MVQQRGYIDVRETSIEKRPPLKRFVVPRGDVVAYFSNVSSKNDVVDGFLELAERCFSNLAVFSVFNRDIQFLKGRGENIKESPHIGAYNIDRNTIIRRAIINRFPYRGPIPVGEDEKRVFSRFFNRFAEEVFIYPAAIHDEDTDILFYADTFEAERSSSIVTLEYIIEKAVLSLKYLWVKKCLNTI